MGQSLVPLIREYVDLDRQVAFYRRSDISEWTAIHYRNIWRLFANFMAPKDAWRADRNDIARWIASRAVRGITPHTIRRDLAAVHYYFEILGKGGEQGQPGKGVKASPGRDAMISRVLRGVERKHGHPPARKTPLTLDSLEKIVDHEPSDKLCGVRNKAMLVLAWGAALRIDEVRMLDVAAGGNGFGWIEISDDGVLVHLVRSKTNPYGRFDELYAVPARTSAPKYCPVRLLRDWLSESGHESGPLFWAVGNALKAKNRRICRGVVRYALKRGVARIGLNASEYSGHSLRAGCLTWLATQNVNIHQIQEHAGHRDIRSLSYYIRKAKTPADSPLTGTQWTS